MKRKIFCTCIFFFVFTAKEKKKKLTIRSVGSYNAYRKVENYTQDQRLYCKWIVRTLLRYFSCIIWIPKRIVKTTNLWILEPISRCNSSTRISFELMIIVIWCSLRVAIDNSDRASDFLDQWNHHPLVNKNSEIIIKFQVEPNRHISDTKTQ